MEYFYSSGGNNRPWFTNRIKVKAVSNEMHEWCTNYDSEGRPFRRWHVEWGSNRGLEFDVIQFEWEQAALLFALKFGDYIA